MDQTLEKLRSSLGDRYRVEKAVGRGGMATVYLAHDLRHDRQVAIKVLSPELTATVGAERFIREIKIAAQLSHPNILGVFDSGEAAGLLYYVMPYIDGESLRQKLMREGQLSIDETIQITCEVAEALGYAHSRDIVHRDIKPENILLQAGRALIADFGIARLTDQAAEKLTGTGMAVGTAAYMSPEQAQGELTDARGDIYALGCTLFEMLAGQPPFSGVNAMQIMSQHSMATVPEIRAMRQSVPEELDGVIRRAMEKAAVDRFQTMEEFKAAVLGEIPATTATLPRFTARYRSQSRADQGRGWREWLIVGVVVAGIIGGGTLLAQRFMGDKAVPPDAAKLAVLYFEDETGGSLQHVADGVTEALIERLEAIPTLTVIPASGVRAFRGRRDVPRDTVRAVFGIGTILNGFVRREGGAIEVSMNLIDAVSGDRYDRKSVKKDTAEIAALPAAVAEEVGEFLREHIGKELRLRTERVQTKSTTAWILGGRAARLRKDADSLIGARSMDAALIALTGADSLLRAARGSDPRWAKLPATRAGIAVIRAQLVPRKTPLEVAIIDSGIAQADSAIRLQQNNADAHEAKGKLLYLRYAHDLEPDAASANRSLAAAESTLLKAVEFDRSQATAWAALSNLYYSKQDLQAARDAAERAYRADAYLASA
ncbi:MAG: serine/threonine-protein kinase, partial [Gemmatimonadaceae bacterium]